MKYYFQSWVLKCRALIHRDLCSEPLPEFHRNQARCSWTAMGRLLFNAAVALATICTWAGAGAQNVIVTENQKTGDATAHATPVEIPLRSFRLKIFMTS
jgi:hypothetical protein